MIEDATFLPRLRYRWPWRLSSTIAASELPPNRRSHLFTYLDGLLERLGVAVFFFFSFLNFFISSGLIYPEPINSAQQINYAQPSEPNLVLKLDFVKDGLIGRLLRYPVHMGSNASLLLPNSPLTDELIVRN